MKNKKLEFKKIEDDLEYSKPDEYKVSRCSDCKDIISNTSSMFYDGKCFYCFKNSKTL